MSTVKSFVFGMKPTDPLAILWAAGILLAALVLAGYAPATRASRIDPLALCGTSNALLIPASTPAPPAALRYLFSSGAREWFQAARS